MAPSGTGGMVFHVPTARNERRNQKTIEMAGGRVGATSMRCRKNRIHHVGNGNLVRRQAGNLHSAGKKRDPKKGKIGRRYGSGGIAIYLKKYLCRGNIAHPASKNAGACIIA